MHLVADFTRVKTSWTKFDIVQVLDATRNLDILEKFKTKQVHIDEPILRSFLGLKSLSDPTPDYWIKLQEFTDKEKKVFSFLALMFTHGGIVKEFAEEYTTGNGKGVFLVDGSKQHTNIRSALVESESSEIINRRSKSVPFDFTAALLNPQLGVLFKLVLNERVSRIIPRYSEENFYNICYQNQFHTAIGLTEAQFRAWLEGRQGGVYIKRIVIPAFYSLNQIDVDFGKSKEIYFLGENGDGKSLLLMAIYLAFNGNFVQTRTEYKQTGTAADFLRSRSVFQLQGFDEIGNEYGPSLSGYLSTLFAYGTHRGRCFGDSTEKYGFMSLFSPDEILVNPVTWLKDLKLAKSNDSSTNNRDKSQLGYIISSIESMLFDLLEKNVKIEIAEAKVNFIEKGVELDFPQLSEGYKSILIFVSDLLYRFTQAYKNAPIDTPIKGVVMVDEIDLHLHPKWQRVVVKRLRELFPNVQFIFTTHSPTIIQGASEDAVMYRVYRDNINRSTKISDPYFRKDFDDLMIDTLITSPLFGLDDARMNSSNNNADTSETYQLYRINLKLTQKILEEKAKGKAFIERKEIDKMIDEILQED